jgi:hypothetical protein
VPEAQQHQQHQQQWQQQLDLNLSRAGAMFTIGNLKIAKLPRSTHLTAASRAIKCVWSSPGVKNVVCPSSALNTFQKQTANAVKPLEQNCVLIRRVNARQDCRLAH